MFALAVGNTRPVVRSAISLETEARVRMIDGLPATAVLVGLILNAAVGWRFAGPAAAFVIVYYGLS